MSSSSCLHLCFLAVTLAVISGVSEGSSSLVLKMKSRAALGGEAVSKDLQTVLGNKYNCNLDPDRPRCIRIGSDQCVANKHDNNVYAMQEFKATVIGTLA